MAKKSVPIGFCKDCRWAREFPPGMKLGPFGLDCQALPWQYAPSQQESKVKDPSTGKSITQMSMMYIPHPQLDGNYCAFFDPRPVEAEAELPGADVADDDPDDEDEGLL